MSEFKTRIHGTPKQIGKKYPLGTRHNIKNVKTFHDPPFSFLILPPSKERDKHFRVIQSHVNGMSVEATKKHLEERHKIRAPISTSLAKYKHYREHRNRALAFPEARNQPVHQLKFPTIYESARERGGKVKRST